MNWIRAFASPVFFTVFVFHFCLPLAVAQTSPFWTTFQHDSRHSGLSPFVGPQTDTVKWTLDLFDAPVPSVGPTGLIYLALCSPDSQCWNWKLIAVNPDGTIAFQTATYFGRAGSTPTIADDGTIYVGTRTSSGSGHDLYAFYPDGSFKWKISLWAFGQSVTLGPDGAVYVPLGGGWPTSCELLALNPDGTSKWIADCMGRAYLNAAAVAPNGNIIVTGVTSGHWTFVAAHSSADGSQLWSLTYPTLPAEIIGYPFISPPSVAPDGTIHFSTSSSSFGGLRLWAVSATGQLLWSSQNLSPGGGLSTPALAPDGTILIATSGYNAPPETPARLFAFSPSGQVRWSVDLANPTGVPQVAVDANGTSYVSLNANGCSAPCATTPLLFAVNSNGSLLWSHSAVIANSNVLGSANTLYAILLDPIPTGGGIWRLYSFSSPGLPAPSITSISPSSGVQGQTITNLTVAGSNFQATSTLSFSGSGITVNSYSSRTTTQIMASITIAVDAPTGARDVFVTNPDGQQAARGAGFTVVPAPPPPPPPSISPPPLPTYGIQGQNIPNFTVTGNNFQPTSTLSFSGTKITVNSYGPRTATQIVASISIAVDAIAGFRDVTVINPDFQQATLRGAFQVIARRVIVIDIDGLRRDAFRFALYDGLLQNFEKILGGCPASAPDCPGGRSFEKAVYFENATTVFPSVTLTGHASIFTGTYPGRHGIVGNQWFDRRSEVLKRGLPQPLQSDLVDYMDPITQLCIYAVPSGPLTGAWRLANYLINPYLSHCGNGLANDHLQSGTVYEAASRAEKSSTVIFNQYWKGARPAVHPSEKELILFGLAEKNWLTQDPENFRRYDRRMIDPHTLDAVRSGFPDVLTLYFAGLDATGHKLGLETASGDDTQVLYLRDTIDPQIASLLEELKRQDPHWQESTLFIITADHGQTRVSNPNKVDITGLILRAVGDIPAAPVMAGPLVSSTPKRVQLATNGGMAHLYVRAGSNAAWSVFPNRTEVLAVADKLYRDLNVGPYIGSIMVSENGPGSGYKVYVGEPVPIPARENPLVQGLDSARSGDILISLRPGIYFEGSENDLWGNRANHGSIHEPDLTVPLVLAGGMVKLSPCATGPCNRSSELVRTVNIAATIGAFLGFSVSGAEPPLPVEWK